MFAVRSSWLFILIKFFIIFGGNRVVIGRVPGHRTIQGYWNPQKLASENIADNEMPNRVFEFADYGSVNRQQTRPSTDFVFPDEVFVPLPERLNDLFSIKDRVPTGNMDKYYYYQLSRNEERPEYVDSVPEFIPDIDGRGAIDVPLIECPEGERRDPVGKCRRIIRTS